MVISPTCNKCGKELIEFGGLIFSPPNIRNLVEKYHLCKNCYKILAKEFE